VVGDQTRSCPEILDLATNLVTNLATNLATMPMSVAYTSVTRFLPTFHNVMNMVPSDSDQAPRPGAKLVKTIASLMNASVETKAPQQIVDDHKTSTVFAYGKEPSPQTLNQSWWESADPNRPQLLVRNLVSLGPATTMTPPYFKKNVKEGILCESAPENNNLSPIEFIAIYATNIFSREEMDAQEVMAALVEIFTEITPLGNAAIDGLSFVFNGKKTVRANRLDLVHALRILFYTGYMIFFANPTAFKFFHPLILITNVFLAQKNFFPSDSDMDLPLSEAEKNNYLLSLGLNIYEAMRNTFEGKFFLNCTDLFPATVNPTMMPPPPAPLFLGVVDGVDQPPEDNIFRHRYFLFGENVPEDSFDFFDFFSPLMFDHSILSNFKAAEEYNFKQLTEKEIKNLLIICCPKTTLTLDEKKRKQKNNGLGKRSEMITLLKQYITTFATKHAAYLNELEGTKADSGAD
jgi:hypothetical protein